MSKKQFRIIVLLLEAIAFLVAPFAWNKFLGFLLLGVAAFLASKE